MEKNEELDMAWQLVENTGANVFLTGKAGTGKTTFLRELRRQSPKRMVVLAPTGIAAINAGGSTIHSFFQLPLSPYVPGASFGAKEKRRYQFGKVKRNILRTLDLLVIDEISMVRADLLDAVDSVMRRYRRHDLRGGAAAAHWRPAAAGPGGERRRMGDDEAILRHALLLLEQGPGHGPLPDY